MPAPGIDGYSLDLMRRDDGEHPNGLLDFILVRTIERLSEQGDEHLGLNFAAMRAVLAGEDGGGLPALAAEADVRLDADRVALALQREVRARVAGRATSCGTRPRVTLATALAIARAESFWELPLIGRFLQPSGAPDSISVAPPCPPAEATPEAAPPVDVPVAGGRRDHDPG